MSEDGGDLHNDTSEEYLRNITEFIEANLGNQSHQTKWKDEKIFCHFNYVQTKYQLPVLLQLIQC